MEGGETSVEAEELCSSATGWLCAQKHAVSQPGLRASQRGMTQAPKAPLHAVQALLTSSTGTVCCWRSSLGRGGCRRRCMRSSRRPRRPLPAGCRPAGAGPPDGCGASAAAAPATAGLASGLAAAELALGEASERAEAERAAAAPNKEAAAPWLALAAAGPAGGEGGGSEVEARRDRCGSAWS